MEPLTFFHAPQSRSDRVAVLLEELRAPHVVRLVNLKAGEQRQPAFLAVNPMGKVPAVLHGGALVTEQVAIYLYLADLFPAAGLAPALGDPDRGPYLRWLAFYGSCFEPAVVDRAMKREPARPAASPYGTFDDMFDTLTAQLRAGPYMLGQRLSAADLLWGSALARVTLFGLLPERAEVGDYVRRVTARPAFATAQARDAEVVAAWAEQGASSGA